ADAPGQRLVARVHLVGPVRVDHRRDDLPAVLQLLEPVDGVRVGIDVDQGVAHLVGREELLHPLAVRAPRCRVHGHDRLVRSGHGATTLPLIPKERAPLPYVVTTSFLLTRSPSIALVRLDDLVEAVNAAAAAVIGRVLHLEAMTDGPQTAKRYRARRCLPSRCDARPRAG